MEQFINDDMLVTRLTGFKNGYADVNGTTLHYVEGGSGTPLVLLPGWPQTWWAFHKMMPALAQHYKVIVVDIRGMGGSSKPQSGYDKKNMAKDILELVTTLGYDKVAITGHDIGANVAFSFAANYPQHTSKLIMLDTPHPDENMYKLPMLPVGMPVYPWWVAFNQVKQLPEELLEGRYNLLQDWLFEAMLIDKESISKFDREVYANSYNSKDAIRASNAWYQAFTQDIEDMKSYGKLTVPVAGIGSKAGCQMLGYSLAPFADDIHLVEIENSGHFIMEENPDAVTQAILEFLK